jgi:hypothetical protein
LKDGKPGHNGLGQYATHKNASTSSLSTENALLNELENGYR